MYLPEALRLADLGWHVFALGPTGHPYPNCKTCKETCRVAEDYETCDHLICHATYAGTTERRRIEAMWTQLPQSLIGVRTGAPSGLIVLDFDYHSDTKDGREVFKQLRDAGALPRTVAANTGGGGLHLFYRYPGKPTPNDNRGKLGAGLDVKGDGGFIVAAPSAKRGKPSYSWRDGQAPWQIELGSLDSKVLAPLWKEPERRTRQVTDEGFVLVADGSALLEAFETGLDVLRLTNAGSRNENLYRAACRGGEVVAARLRTETEVTTQLEEAALDAGMTARDGYRGTIRSGVNRGARDLEDK